MDTHSRKKIWNPKIQRMVTELYTSRIVYHCFSEIWRFSDSIHLSLIFEYVIMDVRMRFNDMDMCTHSSFKPYELAHLTYRHVWKESRFLIWTLSYLFCHLPRVSFFTFLVIVDIRVSHGILKERNRWWLSHENGWSLRHLRAHLMCYRDLKLAYLVRLWFLKTPYSRE